MKKIIFLLLAIALLFPTEGVFAAPKGTTQVLKWADTKVAKMFEQYQIIEAEAAEYQRIKQGNEPEDNTDENKNPILDDDGNPIGQDDATDALCIFQANWPFFFSQRLDIGTSNVKKSWEMLKQKNSCLTRDVNEIELRISKIINMMEHVSQQCRTVGNLEKTKVLFEEAEKRIHQFQLLRDRLLEDTAKGFEENDEGTAKKDFKDFLNKNGFNNVAFSYVTTSTAEEKQKAREDAEKAERKDLEMLDDIHLEHDSYKENAQCSEVSRFYGFQQVKAQWTEVQRKVNDLGEKFQFLEDFGKDTNDTRAKTKAKVKNAFDDFWESNEEDPEMGERSIQGWVGRNIEDVAASFNMELRGGVQYINRSEESKESTQKGIAQTAKDKAEEKTNIPDIQYPQPKTNIFAAVEKYEKEYQKIYTCVEKDLTLKIDSQNITGATLEKMDTNIAKFLHAIEEQNEHYEKLTNAARAQCAASKTCE